MAQHGLQGSASSVGQLHMGRSSGNVPWSSRCSFLKVSVMILVHVCVHFYMSYLPNSVISASVRTLESYSLWQLSNRTNASLNFCRTSSALDSRAGQCSCATCTTLPHSVSTLGVYGINQGLCDILSTLFSMLVVPWELCVHGYPQKFPNNRLGAGHGRNREPCPVLWQKVLRPYESLGLVRRLVSRFLLAKWREGMHQSWSVPCRS